MQQPAPVPVPTPVPAPTLPMTTAAPVTGVDTGSITIPAFTHAGISVEFECTKPEIWNKQNSVLVAKFKNSSGAPIYGLNLQCAVPKYVTMEMTPPTSTTVPVTGGQGREVTQTIKITNTMLGTKNLMLKLKISFTSNGNKIDHMATCSGFPAGVY
jgi:AP-1 complex subunit gamma-1